jgi:hypothetical protein
LLTGALLTSQKFYFPGHHNNLKYYMAFQVLTAISEDSGFLGYDASTYEWFPDISNKHTAFVCMH